VPLITLVVLGIRCYREQRLRESLPLLATQVNSAIIWGCLAVEEVGIFKYYINGTLIIKGDPESLRNWTIRIFLFDLIYLEPLNLFLYTWRFLRELEQGEKNTFIKKCYKWFARISIVLLPPAFLCIVPAWIVEYGRYYYYLERLDIKEANHYRDIANSLFKTIEILGPVTSLISCLILALVIRHIYRLSK
jgi:hypothetical protein